ncbi:MAG: hypothetical protein K2K77_02585 [Duncaniella sp.]|nr:hypothetical protein [Duncaniella sp.]
MTRKETRFTNVLRSRGVGIILALSGLWMAWRCLPSITPSGVLGDYPEISCGVNLFFILATAVSMIAINRRFTLLRTMSVFFAAYFTYITCATPAVADIFGPSSLLAWVMMWCMGILFTLYHRRRSDRRIFLIFCLLSAGTMYDWRFAFYIPLFFVGMVQMRIFRFKKIVAAIVGLLTPPWIVFGLDLLPVSHYSLPNIYFTPPSILLETPDAWPFLCTVLFTMVVGFVCGSTALFRILGYNARARAYNGFLAMLGIYTGVLAIINFTDITTYVTLLNACVAMQVGHFFRATASRRGYIIILLLIAAYAGLYFWSFSV